MKPAKPRLNSQFDFIDPDSNYPDPTDEDLESPLFEAVWEAIKMWDISRDPGRTGYSGATGSDVMYILEAIRKEIEKNYSWRKTINPL